MRDRLGIGSRDELDVENIRRKRAVKEEQASALNRVLQKEVWFSFFLYNLFRIPVFFKELMLYIKATFRYSGVF